MHTRPHSPYLHPSLQYVLWAWNRKRRATRKKEIHSNAEWKLAFAPKMHLSNAWMVFNDGSGSCWFFIMQSWRLLLEMGTRAKTHPTSVPCHCLAAGYVPPTVSTKKTELDIILTMNVAHCFAHCASLSAWCCLWCCMAAVVEGHQEPSHEDNDAAIFITESKPTDIREPKL